MMGNLQAQPVPMGPDKEKLELKLQEWNDAVSDETQCMHLSQDEEIALLSSRSSNCKLQEALSLLK